MQSVWQMAKWREKIAENDCALYKLFVLRLVCFSYILAGVIDRQCGQ